MDLWAQKYEWERGSDERAGVGEEMSPGNLKSVCLDQGSEERSEH
jgi:hypothetical protein